MTVLPRDIMTVLPPCYRCLSQPCVCSDRITLYHADSTLLIPLLPPFSINCIVTSPPYNQLGGTDREKLSGMWKEGSTGDFVDCGYSDKISESSYQSWQNELFSTLVNHTTKDASLFYNHQVRWRNKQISIPSHWFHPFLWKLRQEIIWDRGGGIMLNARMFNRCEERILWFTKNKWKWSQKSVVHGSVWNITPERKKPHPVMFPQSIPRRCILATTDPGDLVLDPFAGGGTVGRVCKDIGRRCILIEKEKKYCDIITRELKQKVLF